VLSTEDDRRWIFAGLADLKLSQDACREAVRATSVNHLRRELLGLIKLLH
jgi:hypothetical protein